MASNGSRLSAALQGESLVLTWTAGPNTVLQRSVSLTDPNWLDVTGTAGVGSLTEQIEGPTAFYRLIQR